MINFGKTKKDKITKIVIPSKVGISNGWWENTFTDFRSLSEVSQIPDNVVFYLKNTFRNCSSLIKCPNGGNSVTGMIDTFRGCSKLTDAVCYPNVTNMLVVIQTARI